MWRIARLALTWLLALALPLQGLSAATMMACSDGGHATASVGAIDHGHSGAMSHDHSAAGPAHTDKTDSGKGAKHRCSVCASCCTTAVASPGGIAFAPIRSTFRFAPLATHSIAAHVSDGLERPPRPFPA